MKWMFLTWLLIYSIPTQAGHLHPERWYQERWCTAGEMEYRLDDGTRVDCLTPRHAVEIDFANKWYQGYAQALWYAANTGRRAALLLIIESEKDLRYFDRAERMRDHYGHPIDIWMITGSD